jgi:hypothetical protein
VCSNNFLEKKAPAVIRYLVFGQLRGLEIESKLKSIFGFGQEQQLYGWLFRIQFSSS